MIYLNSANDYRLGTVQTNLIFILFPFPQGLYLYTHLNVDRSRVLFIATNGYAQKLKLQIRVMGKDAKFNKQYMQRPVNY